MWYIEHEEQISGMWVDIIEDFDNEEDMLKRYNELVSEYWLTGEPIHWGKKK